VQDPGSYAAGGAMNDANRLRERLQGLVQVPGAPPYDHEEFLRRRAERELRLRRRRLRVGQGSALAASVALALLTTGLWRQGGGLSAAGGAAAPRPVDQVVAAESSSALVRAGTLAARDALEERIAMIDLMLTEGRLAGTQQEALQAMERGRSTLVDSLQQVAHAQELIGP
jgi:hypothetical protein